MNVPDLKRTAENAECGYTRDVLFELIDEVAALKERPECLEQHLTLILLEIDQIAGKEGEDEITDHKFAEYVLVTAVPRMRKRVKKALELLNNDGS